MAAQVIGRYSCLFQEHVGGFKNLGLVIIDGASNTDLVSAAIKGCVKGILGAITLSVGDDRNTIPRTLAMTAYADLETSQSRDELPQDEHRFKP